MLGGSPYYLIAGCALLASGFLLWHGRRLGAYVYGLLTLGTLIWALYEAGLDGWALAPRVLPFLVLGLFLLRPGVRRALGTRDPHPLWREPLTWICVVALAGICVGIAQHGDYPVGPFPNESPRAAAQDQDWKHWGRTQAGTRYAPFDQINTTNVGTLTPAWTYRTGVAGAFKATPLQVGNT